MDTDIADQIDRSLGSGPPARPSLEELLVQGHRAVRRRHLAVATASGAAVLVVALTASMISGASGHRADAPVAPQPTGPAMPTETSPPTATPAGPGTAAAPTRAEARDVLHRVFVTLDAQGQVQVTEGTVLRVVENPFGVAPPAASVGVQLQVGGGVYWYAVYNAPDGGGRDASIYAPDAKRPFEGWLQRMSGIADGGRSVVGPDVWPGVADLDLVAFVGDTEELAASDGVTILEQRAHVRVGDSFAGPGDQTAAAEVRAADGTGYYVLARRFDGKPGQYIAVPVEQGGRDLDAFLELARTRYAEGGGGLL